MQLTHAGLVRFDAAALRQLQDVNAAVNALPYVTDLAQYGELEHWGCMGLQGDDCDGYAMEKQARLRELGWPMTALRLAVCTYRGAGHCVLSVDTDAGTYILDNRHAAVAPWEQASFEYDWIERQAREGGGWVAIPKA